MKSDSDYEVHYLRVDDKLHSLVRAMLSGNELSSLSANQRRRIRRLTARFRLIDGVLYKRDWHYPKRYVNVNERIAILRNYHGGLDVPHMGINATFNIVRRKYWWPRMYEDVKKFVGGCETCQVFERKMKTARQLHRIPPPN